MPRAKKWASYGPYVIGAAAWFCLVATMVFGYFRDGGTPTQLAYAVTGAFCLSLAIVGMSAKGLKALFYGTMAGLVVGIFSAIELFIGDRFERAFIVSFATLAFFTVLGIVIGILAELIRLLHLAMHRATEAGIKKLRESAADPDDLP